MYEIERKSRKYELWTSAKLKRSFITYKGMWVYGGKPKEMRTKFDELTI